MNRQRRIAIAAALLLIAVSGYAAFSLWTDDSGAAAITLYGNVDIREVELGFRVAGRLQGMEVDEGDPVRAAQRLAWLDPEPYRDELAVAEARVAQAEATLEKMQRGNRPQEIQQARAAVRAAEAELTNAERDFRRQRGLIEAGASSQKSVDAARARYEAAAAQLAAAREGLDLAQAGFRREDVAAAEAALAVAVAERDRAETRLEDTELLAPSDGTILARVREPGAILQEGAPVYTVSLDRPVYVRAYVGEPELGHAVPGATVFVTTDSSAKRYRGQIGFVSPRAEFTPKSVETTDLRTDLVYRLRIVVADADDGLRQGMPVTVHLPLAQGED